MKKILFLLATCSIATVYSMEKNEKTIQSLATIQLSKHEDEIPEIVWHSTQNIFNHLTNKKSDPYGLFLAHLSIPKGHECVGVQDIISTYDPQIHRPVNSIIFGSDSLGINFENGEKVLVKKQNEKISTSFFFKKQTSKFNSKFTNISKCKHTTELPNMEYSQYVELLNKINLIKKTKGSFLLDFLNATPENPLIIKDDLIEDFESLDPSIKKLFSQSKSCKFEFKDS